MNALLRIPAPLALLALAAGLASGPIRELAPDRAASVERAPTDPLWVQGVTISCQGWGRAWGTPGFDAELDDLSDLGANWIAIHPYARIHADGSLTWGELEPVPEHLARPLRAARERGLSLFVKPHLSYWGSPFAWRGAIDFPEPAARERFWRDYTVWIGELASAVQGAEAFSVGTELDRFLGPADEPHWRALVADVRGRTDAHLTYAANWTDYRDVPFWDALDAIGVQAYFPLVAPDLEAERAPASDTATNRRAALERAWAPHLAELREHALRTGKPVVFTELGYPASLAAAREPWSYAEERGERAEEAERLQSELLAAALELLQREREWLRGAFLWKWFVGDVSRANFRLDTPRLRAVMAQAWRRAPADD